MNFESLQSWAKNYSSAARQERNPSFDLVYCVYEILCCQNQAAGIWNRGVIRFIETSQNHLNDFDIADDLLKSFQIEFTQLTSEILESVIIENKNLEAIENIKSLADRCGITAFRFLSAWVRLNTNDLEGCIDECEKVEQPTSTVCTLQGQAYFENNKVDEAIDCLNIATSLNPKDPMPFYLLAKAYYAKGKYSAALDVLQTCKGLSSPSDEITLLELFILANQDLGEPREFPKHVSKLIHLNPTHEEAFHLAFQYANRTQNTELIENIVEAANITSFSKTSSFLKRLPEYLMTLNSPVLRNAQINFLSKSTQ